MPKGQKRKVGKTKEKHKGKTKKGKNKKLTSGFELNDALDLTLVRICVIRAQRSN